MRSEELHALLAPRPALLALVPGNLRDRPYSALHVRLGDGNMNTPGAVHAQSTWLVGKPPLAWHWLNESRPLESGFSRSAPSGLLRCFATALPAPHVVISDTEAVLAAARMTAPGCASVLEEGLAITRQRLTAFWKAAAAEVQVRSSPSATQETL